MTGNIPSSSKGKTGKNTVIESVEDSVDKFPDSYFSKAATRVFNKIDNGKDGIIPSSKSVDLIEKVGYGYHN